MHVSNNSNAFLYALFFFYVLNIFIFSLAHTHTHWCYVDFRSVDQNKRPALQSAASSSCLIHHEKWIIFAAAFESCHQLLSDLAACSSGEVRCLLPLGQLSCYKEAVFKHSEGHLYLPLIFMLANQQSLMFLYLRIQHAFFSFFLPGCHFLLVSALLADALRVCFFPPHPSPLASPAPFAGAECFHTSPDSRLVFSRRLLQAGRPFSLCPCTQDWEGICFILLSNFV